MTPKTHTHQAPDGPRVEYRRAATAECVFALEARELRPDGTPYDERWYPVSDREFVRLQDCGSGVVEALRAEAE